MKKTLCCLSVVLGLCMNNDVFSQIVVLACPKPNSLMYSLKHPSDSRGIQLVGEVDQLQGTGSGFLLKGPMIFYRPTLLREVEWRRDHMCCHYDMGVKLVSEVGENPVLNYCHFKNQSYTVHHCVGTREECELVCEVL